jgi:hypothetical protein
MGGGFGGGGMGGSRGHHRGSATGSATGPARAGAVDRWTEQRAEDVRDAIRRAFAVLDAPQQQAATKLLADHDIDVDTGGPASTGEPQSVDPADDQTR